MRGDVKKKQGYSIKNPSKRAEWKELLRSIRERLDEYGLHETVLFHGTSELALEDISVFGMDATDCSHAVHPDKSTGFERGSFWGNLDTAVAYADDTAEERHPGSHPVIIAVTVAELERYCTIVPDGATFDFPLPGLTRLGEPGVSESWTASWETKTWRDALTDLGAVAAFHDTPLPTDLFAAINSTGDFDEFVNRTTDRTPTVSAARP